MTGKKLGKVFLVWLCIITLIMPFTTEVLAATLLTSDDTATVLESMPLREGGEESTDVNSSKYDQSQYSYSISDVNVLKVVQEDDYTYADTFYCLDAMRTLTIQHSHNYVKAADDLTDYSNPEVTEWANSVGITKENFNSLMYLLKNIYAKKLDPTYKDTFIEKAFAKQIQYDEENNVEPATTVQTVKENLTDDDIEVIQQWAIWYFTNGSNKDNNQYKSVFESLGNIEVKKLVPTGEGAGVTEVEEDLQTVNKSRKLYADILYNYLIESAKEAATGSSTYPTNRNLSLWVGEDDNENLQPLVLLLPEEPAEYDLALRKFIVSVDGVAQNRTPVPTPSSLEKLANGSATTAEYTHAKNPVQIEKGNKIVYEFRIYNEGEVDVNNVEIIDYLPEGLKLVENSEINVKYGWVSNGNEISTTKHFVGDVDNGTIKAFDKSTKQLSYGFVQLEVEMDGDISEGTTLTNVAEIRTDDGKDRDSIENSIDKGTITNDWTGDSSNKDDLTDKNYHYKGVKDEGEDLRGDKGDDNDFEKVVIAGKQFDLSLKKFISTVNGKEQNRAPQVDVTPLKNGGDDANYTVSKNPVDVQTGDIVTFTLRVYNEGEIDGYAEEITDYIPDGLGFLVNYNTNFDNRWAISENSNSISLSEIKNGKANLNLSDFSASGEVESLDDVAVVTGKAKITSDALASSETSTENEIKAFDGTTLSYKDIQVSFIVVTEDEITLKNIAAITSEADKDRNPVDTDRGPDKDSTPKDDIDPDKYTTGNEDDDDYDVVKTDKKDFDLALQKFITRLNDTEVTDRAPVVSVTDGEIKYNSPNPSPLYVGNGDLVEYTIRVYNEGEIDGYAAEITDDIPNGLVFVPDNATNQEFGWKMYDKSGNETTDPSQAVSVKTTYLSKEASEDNIIKAFDGSNLTFKDVKLVFKVDETAIEKTVTTEKRTLTNTAEITKNTDKDGNEIPDIDSTPNNNKPGEDDIDQEQVYVKYFDLALEKNLNKAIVTTNGETHEVTGDQLKIEIHRKNIDSTSIQFVYTVKVTNQGEVEGYATEVTDYIPEGLSFNPASNPDWVQASDRIIKTEALAKTLLQPGESAEVQVVLDWVRNSENIGRFINVAEISEDWNPYGSDDIDSTPNNLIADEDDQDDAPVWVGISTGLGDRPYIILSSTVLMIIATGLVLIKKYVI